MKTAIISTVYNERCNIDAFLRSLLQQSELPDEIVVVDGGSQDGTFEVTTGFIGKFRERGCTLQALQKNCNISEGRNLAVRATDAEILCVVDAGVVVDFDWYRQISRPLREDSSLDCVGGNFEIGGEKYVQRSFCLMGYKNKARNNPSSRSFAFRRKCWEAYAYPETLKVHEDTKLCNEWRRLGFRFGFAPEACVTWQAEDTLPKLYRKYARYNEWSLRSGDRMDWMRRLQLSTYILMLAALPVSVALAGAVVGLSVILRLLRQCARGYRNQEGFVRLLVLLPGAVAVQIMLDLAVIGGSLQGLKHKLGKASAA